MKKEQHVKKTEAMVKTEQAVVKADITVETETKASVYFTPWWYSGRRRR